MKTLVSILVLSVIAPAAAAAQIPVGSRVGSDTVPATASTYDDGGRRDPFVTLVQKKGASAATGATGKPAAGLGALGVADVTVTGIVKAGGGFIATLRSHDGKSFTAKTRDRLQDGEVKSIDAEGVVFVQEMADALGVVKPREVRKTLRQTGAEQ